MPNVIYGPNSSWPKMLQVHSINHQETIYYWFCFEGKTYYKSINEIEMFAVDNFLNIQYVYNN